MRVKPCVRFALALFVWVLLFSAESILIVLSAMVLHELAHVIACRILGVKICSITPLPWGVAISTPVLFDWRMRIIVSAAGPICNVIIFVICLLIKNFFSLNSSALDFFALSHFADGLLNLLPVLPFDGGTILNSYLCVKKGFSFGYAVSIKLTVIVGAFIFLAGIQIFITSGCNFSLTIVGFFVLLNLRHEKEVIICIKKQILTEGMEFGKKIKYVNIDYNCSALCLVNMINSEYTLIFLVNRNGRFVGELNQHDIIAALLKCSLITVGECIEK